ncbi:MAG: hypothetical protein ACLFUR_04255 [Candidatus Hadarchaeia archaeon]
MTSITFKSNSDKEYHLEVGEMNSNILSAGSPGRVKRISKHLDNAETVEGDRGLTVVHGEHDGMGVSAFATGMGPASASITLPEAIELAEDPIILLRLGTAGSLQPHVKIGDIVIPSGAIRDESTTTAVVGSEYPSVADPALVPVLVKAANQYGFSLGENLWNGIVHVKDDLHFKETPNKSPSKEIQEPKLKSYERLGALSSSMEFSVYTIMRDFYKASENREIVTGALLGIIARKSKNIELEEEVKKRLEKDMIKIGLKSLKLVRRLKSDEKVESEYKNILKKLFLT